MSSIGILMGLLALAYAGSFLVGKRAARGGLPASTEYVLLGFVLGPSALGLVERSHLLTFEPVAHAALGWLALVLGLQCGVHGVRRRRVRWTRLVGAWIAFLFTAACIGAAVWAVLLLTSRLGVGRLLPTDRLVVAGGVGVSTAETTRYAVRWIVDRDRAAGPVTDLVGDLVEADDLLPLLAVAALFAWSPQRDLALAHGPRWIGLAVTLGLGAIFGAMVAVLLGRTFRLAEAWSVMLGMSMLTIGTASRLGLASITAMFVMGAAIAVLSRHRDDIDAMVAPTERPVMLPALLLAGASIDVMSSPWLPWVLGAALTARIAAKALVGLSLLVALPAVRPAGPLLGFGLCSAGVLSMSLGLTFLLRFPGAVGGAVLAAAAVATAAGELIGPQTLRFCLRRAGEVPEPDSDKRSKGALTAEAPAPPTTGGPAPRPAVPS